MKGAGPRTYDNPLDGLRYAILKDSDRNRRIPILYPIPLPDEPWGTLLPLKETSWGSQIPIVTGEALSHALHGTPKPLLEMLGRLPQGRPLRLPMEDRRCLEAQQGLCQLASQHCVPGSGKLPQCYVAPCENTILRALAIAVGRAWDEGRYVFVVEGPEFTLR